MGDREFESELTRLLRADSPAGTAGFRDALLARCLEVLGEDAGDGSASLADDDLRLLAAAGDLSSFGERE